MLDTQSQSDEVLTPADAAKLLKVSERTIWERCSRGELPHTRVGKQIRLLRSVLMDKLKNESMEVK